MNNHWLDIDLTQFSFLQPLSELGVSSLKAWLPVNVRANKLKRTSGDGTWLFCSSGLEQDVAVIWSDFRVNGGSFGGDIANRITSFLKQCEQRHLPLIVVMNTLGYRFMEGRAVFNEVFSLIPTLDSYSRQQLVVTVCHGQCLGLGAILFGLGHYRIGVQENSTLNLTGPDVFRLIFGKKVDFESFASVDQQYVKTSLIHERVHDLPKAIASAYALISGGTDAKTHSHQPETAFLSRQQRKVERACQAMLDLFADTYQPLFVDFDNRMRVYLVEIDGLKFGLLMNPPENSNNMITVRTLKLYQDALRLFQALNIPLVSFLDTPGVDPRMDNSNQDIIQQLIETNRAIIEYPLPKMGVWIGRGFGGANTLVIPKSYGSWANYVLKDRTTLGVMHESIIEHLLNKSQRMMALWRESREKELADFQDIVDAGYVTAAIGPEELKQVIVAFLRGEKATFEAEPVELYA